MLIAGEFYCLGFASDVASAEFVLLIAAPMVASLCIN